MIAVDGLGGDTAPRVPVEGAVAAARSGIDVVLVGPIDQLQAELDRLDVGHLSHLSIVDAPDGVSMDESPLAALRKKPRASIRVACELVASGAADGVYSAGHTGASLLAAHSVFGVLPGVERPTLAVLVPTQRGRSVLLDAGANVDCRASHLAQFGVMGSAYARIVADIVNPRVGLLSIGEEAGKGNELTKEAHAALAAQPINFVGNIDAAQWFRGEADVMVCDGFVGNIALKVGEAVVEMLATSVPANVLDRFDYGKAGGAPLIGTNGLLVVGHGRSDARAVFHGIALTDTLVRGRLVAQVAEAVTRVLK